MADDEKKGPPGVRRSRGGPRKRLPEDLEAFARSDDKRFRPRRKVDTRPRLRDPRRAGVLIPGVANRDARTIYDARANAIREAEPELRAELLAEAILIAVWRGFAITGFDAFVEDALGLSLEEAKREAEQGAKRLGRPLELLTEEQVALWMRVEIGLLETAGRVSCQGDELVVRVPFDRALESLNTVGKRVYPLLRDRDGSDFR